MSDENSFWNFEANIDDNNNEVGQSSINEDIFEFPYACEPAPNYWFQTPSPLITTPPTYHVDDILGYIGSLMDSPIIPTTPLLQPICTFDFPNIPVFHQGEPSVQEIGQSSETIKKAEVKRAKVIPGKKKKKIKKRSCAAEDTTLTTKIAYFQSADRASILDNAVNYVQFMRLQTELMTGSQVTPYITSSGLPGTHGSQYSQFLPTRPKLEMGMGVELFGICYPNGVPVLQAPFHPSFSGGLGMPLMPGQANLAVPQMPMPCYPSQVHQMPNYVSGFSPGLNFPSKLRRSVYFSICHCSSTTTTAAAAATTSTTTATAAATTSGQQQHQQQQPPGTTQVSEYASRIEEQPMLSPTLLMRIAALKPVSGFVLAFEEQCGREDIQKQDVGSETQNSACTSKSQKSSITSKYSTQNVENGNCKLLDWMGTGKVVGEGKVVSKDLMSKVHHIPLGPDYWKIGVTRAIVEDTLLIRPTTEFQVLGHAIGSFIAWPKSYVIFN
ncbi:hypothetical protein Dsin_028905 [Dipteronia sinensis]|uniref:DUF8039 domain-containing protein n=1 Tax=Dipteronia sinensis TaxID=43782 RepID=A0AAD9ZS18_9ROSI|nr:hypothetical protein Dsin_028905 [Dipteronia sinensis]